MVIRYKHESGGSTLSISDTVGRTSSGTAGINKRDDVMLVQWLLAKALQSKDHLGKPLSVDGIYGETTDYWIARYILNYHRSSTGLEAQFTPNTPATEMPNFYMGVGNMYQSRSLNLLESLGTYFSEVDYPVQLRTMPHGLQTALEANVKSVSLSPRAQELAKQLKRP